MERVLSSIAHEIRNPLGMINLYAAILNKNIEKLTQSLDNSDSNKEILDSLFNASSIIANSSGNLEQMLTEMLNYTKPMVLNLQENDINECILNVINLISPSYVQKGVGLNFSVNDTFQTKFDEIKVGQCLINVLKNALEASLAGAKVNVELSKNDSFYSIRISDQGTGISCVNAEKIFLPYFTTKKEGSGIGLAESKKIMQAHQGDLVLLATSNAGSIFELRIPV